jgi:hypothetical protein
MLDLVLSKDLGRVLYLALEMPDRPVYTQQFIDNDENISRHPMVPTLPAARE